MIKRIHLKKFLSLVFMFILVISSSVACSKDKTSNNTIKIATKPMTEQFILAEMLSLLIEDSTNLKVEITKGIGGGTSNIQPAMEKGEFDMYPEYTGTGWSFVLKEEGIPDDETLYKELQKKYEDLYDFKWIGLYGFTFACECTCLTTTIV